MTTRRPIKSNGGKGKRLKSLPTLPDRKRTRGKHAVKINMAWRKTGECIQEVGDCLNEALKELGPAEYKKMVLEDLEMAESTARKLRIAAANPVLRSHVNADKLPAPYTTRYELTKLPDATLQAAIDGGVVHAKMERSEAEALVKRAGKAASTHNYAEITSDPLCGFCCEAVDTYTPPTQLDDSGEPTDEQPRISGHIDSMVKQIGAFLEPRPTPKKYVPYWKERHQKLNLVEKVWRVIKDRDHLHPEHLDRLARALDDLIDRATELRDDVRNGPRPIENDDESTDESTAEDVDLQLAESDESESEDSQEQTETADLESVES